MVLLAVELVEADERLHELCQFLSRLEADLETAFEVARRVRGGRRGGQRWLWLCGRGGVVTERHCREVGVELGGELVDQPKLGVSTDDNQRVVGCTGPCNTTAGIFSRMTVA